MTRIAASLVAARMSCLIALTFAGTSARAQERAPEPSKEPSPIMVIGECPGSGELSAILAPLLGNAPSAALPLPPRVTDLGERFEVAVAGHHDPVAALLSVRYRAQASAMTVILLVLRAYGSVAVITGTRRVIREMMLS